MYARDAPAISTMATTTIRILFSLFIVFDPTCSAIPNGSLYKYELG
jgi:hypothetical protein